MTPEDPGPGGSVLPETAGLVRSIERLTGRVRRAGIRRVPGRPLRPSAPAEGAGPNGFPPRPGAAPAAAAGWWVLAQGAELDPGDFAAREAARDSLLGAVRAHGVFSGENVWVWDETGRAQLVLATLPTRERAERLAERLRAKGLHIAVRREMP